MEQVFVVSYPKCGRTWLRLMLGRALASHFGATDTDLLELDALADRYRDAPRLVFTHDGPANLKTAAELALDDKRAYAGRPVVLLVRDPADVVVSYYFEYTRRRSVFNPDRFEPFEGGISEFIRQERGGLASVIAFYAGWALHGHVPSSLLVVRYEDMHADPSGQLRRVVDAIGVGAMADDVIADAVAFGAFDNMRQLERTHALQSERLTPGNTDDPESFKTRRGVVGGYSDYLNSADLAYVRQLQIHLPAVYRYEPSVTIHEAR